MRKRPRNGPIRGQGRRRGHSSPGNACPLIPQKITSRADMPAWANLGPQTRGLTPAPIYGLRVLEVRSLKGSCGSEAEALAGLAPCQRSRRERRSLAQLPEAAVSSLGMWPLPSMAQPPTSSLTATPEAAILPASYMKEPGHHAEPPPQGSQRPSSSRQHSRHCTCRTRAWCGYLSGALDWTSPGAPHGLQRLSQGSMPGTFAGTRWRPAGRGRRSGMGLGGGH